MTWNLFSDFVSRGLCENVGSSEVYEERTIWDKLGEITASSNLQLILRWESVSGYNVYLKAEARTWTYNIDS